MECFGGVGESARAWGHGTGPWLLNVLLSSGIAFSSRLYSFFVGVDAENEEGCVEGGSRSAYALSSEGSDVS